MHFPLGRPLATEDLTTEAQRNSVALSLSFLWTKQRYPPLKT